MESKRICLKCKQEVYNETDNSGKYYCTNCGPVAVSRTKVAPAGVYNLIGEVEHELMEEIQKYNKLADLAKGLNLKVNASHATAKGLMCVKFLKRLQKLRVDIAEFDEGNLAFVTSKGELN